MANILDYIKWRGDLSFNVDPLNSVDNLVFSRLSYIDYDDIAPQGEELSSIARRYINNKSKMNPGILLNEGNIPLLKGAGESKRFGSVKVKYFISRYDKESQLQFSAVVFEINEDSAFIAFRGTDDTIIGWKEDFNMAFMEVVPAQYESKSYLENVINKYNYSSIYVGGHSKGGNLAIYSTVLSNKNIKDRIIRVYNNDGPGFNHEFLQSDEYKTIKDRIETIIPESSLVGLLLEQDKNYTVVESTEKGIMQHDCFSWNLQGREFITLPSISEDAKILDRTTKNVLEKIGLKEREIFSNVLFDFLSVNNSETLTDLDKGGLKSLFSISQSYNKLDKKTKKLVFDGMVLFLNEAAQSYWHFSKFSEMEDKYNSWKDGVKKDIREFLTKSKLI